MKNLLKIAHYILYFTIFTQPHSACETLDDFYYEPISFPLTGKQKKASLAIGIAELTRRIKIGDEAAIKCKAMPSATMEQQESTLNAYNAELQTLQARLQQGKKIALERGLDQNFKGTPSKAIRIASEQAAAEEERKLQEKIDELERAKKEAEEKAAQLTPLKAQLTTALARERATPHREKAAALQDELETVQKRLEQVEQLRKEAEERISDQLQADAQNMGSVVIGQLQELDSTEKTNQGVTIRKHRRTGRLIEDSSALDLLYESYTKMIADIKEQIDEHHTVCTDVESLNAVFKDALVHVEERQEKRGKQLFNVRFISYENLDKVFDVIDSALLIAQNYMSLQIPDGALDGKSSEEIENFVAEYKAKQAAKLKRDIQNARDDKRPGLVEDIFLNQFLDPASAEMMRLKKSDPLDLCLQCTRSFQEKVKIDEDRGFYPAKAFTQIKGKLSKREGFILGEIKRKDGEIYQQRLIILEEEIQKLEDMIRTSLPDFAAKPMVIQLFVYRPAFFLLTKPTSTIRNPPFANLNRFELELYYLSKQEKEALFAYLFDIAENFNTHAAEYQEKTLTKRTPLALDDINALIKMTKESIHAHDETKDVPEFKPSALTLRDLGDFSVKILDLRLGTTRDVALRNRKTEALQTFKKCMSGINVDALEKYLEIKKSAISEAQQAILTHMWEHRDKAHPSFSDDIELLTANELLAVGDILHDQTLHLDLLKYSRNPDSLNLEILKQLKEQLKDISIDIVMGYQTENATTLSGSRADTINTLLSQRAILEAASVISVDETIAKNLLEAFKVLRDDQHFYGDLKRFNQHLAAAAAATPASTVTASSTAKPKKIGASPVIDFQSIVDAAKEKLRRLTEISEGEREEIQSVIDSVEADLVSGKTNLTEMKTKKLEKNKLLATVVL